MQVAINSGANPGFRKPHPLESLALPVPSRDWIRGLRIPGKSTCVNLQVYLPNAPAIALHTALGFVEYGTEAEAVCLDSRYHDGVHMVLVKDRYRRLLPQSVEN